MDIEKESLESLDFPKLLEILSSFCDSDPGKNILLSSKPLDKKKITKEFLLIKETCNLLNKGKSFSFSALKDVSFSLLSSKKGKALSPENILQIADVLTTSREFSLWIEKEETPSLKEMALTLYTDFEFEREIRKTIDSNGEIICSSPLLKSIKDRQKVIRDEVNSIFKTKYFGRKILQDNFLTLREGRYVIPVRSEMLKEVNGILHGMSNTGATLFVEPIEFISLNNEMVQLIGMEREEKEKIVKRICEGVAKRADEILRSLNLLAYFDTIFARAKFAIKFCACIPKLKDTGGILIKGAKHPIILKMKKEFVPLDIRIDEFRPGLLITGPNGGGKTVLLKTLGLCLLCAHFGIPVLATEAHTPYLSSLHTLLGDDERIEDTKSSFYIQMERIGKIVKNAKGRSFVILDEIGKNTEPSQGCAIGISVVKELLKKGAFVAISTHFNDMKGYAISDGRFQLCSLLLDPVTKRPTFELRYGEVGSSDAFYLAKEAGISENILEDANNFLKSKDSFFEDVIRELKRERESLREKITLLKNTLNKIENLSHLLEELYDSFKERRKDILNKLLSEGRKKISRIIETFSEKREKEIDKVLKEELSFIAEDEEFYKNLSVDVGDPVLIKDARKVGILLGVDHKKEEVEVAISNIKVKMPIDRVERISNLETEKKRSSFHKPFCESENLEVSVVGMKVYEAKAVLDKIIDRAVLDGIKRVSIIHGCGTGKLRGAIREFLKNDPRISSFRPRDPLNDSVTEVFFE